MRGFLTRHSQDCHCGYRRFNNRKYRCKLLSPLIFIKRNCLCQICKRNHGKSDRQNRNEKHMTHGNRYNTPRNHPEQRRLLHRYLHVNGESSLRQKCDSSVRVSASAAVNRCNNRVVGRACLDRRMRFRIPHLTHTYYIRVKSKRRHHQILLADSR